MDPGGKNNVANAEIYFFQSGLVSDLSGNRPVTLPSSFSPPSLIQGSCVCESAPSTMSRILCSVKDEI